MSGGRIIDIEKDTLVRQSAQQWIDTINRFRGASTATSLPHIGKVVLVLSEGEDSDEGMPLSADEEEVARAHLGYLSLKPEDKAKRSLDKAGQGLTFEAWKIRRNDVQ